MGAGISWPQSTLDPSQTASLNDSGSLYRITTFLYTSDASTANNVPWLVQSNIGHVISLERRSPRTQMLRYYQANGISFLHYPMADNPSQRVEDVGNAVSEFFVQNYIQEQDPKATLIYCHRGESRSPVIAMYVLMHAFGTDFATASAVVRNSNPMADPKRFFIQQLVGQA